MRGRLSAITIILLITGTAISTEESARLVLSVEDLPTSLERGDEFAGGAVSDVIHTLGLVYIETSNLQASLSIAFEDEDVHYVELSVEDDPTESSYPDDPLYATTQYGPQLINADEVWEFAKGDGPKSLCVLGSGIRTTHEEFGGSRWLGGYDFRRGDSTPDDEIGHESLATSIATANTNNLKGIAGVSPNTTYYTPKFQGTGSFDSDAASTNAFQSCRDNNTAVYSYSYGSLGTYSHSRATLIQQIWENDSLVVSSTGNGGSQAPCDDDECVIFPGNLTSVVAVGNVNALKQLVADSSTGNETELVAPGFQIVGAGFTLDFGYQTDSGTSFAVPHVAGAAALIWNIEPALPASVLRDILDETAEDLGATGRDKLFGFGLIDAKAAADTIYPKSLPICRFLSPTRFNEYAATAPTISGNVTFKTWTNSTGSTISSVKLLVDSTEYNMLTTSDPHVYELTFDTTGISNAVHTIKTKCVESDAGFREHSRSYTVSN